MKKLLFLPFLQLPSGHHQVADTIINHMLELDNRLICKKVDPLAYTFGKLEKLISGTYLKWIQYLPQTYSWLYQKSVYDEPTTHKDFHLYDMLFTKAIKTLLEEEQPDAVICTHSLPSYIIGRLKQKEHVNVPLINVYTDFFAHHMWAKKEADMHLVSSRIFKDDLVEKGAHPDTIYLTGIPIHKAIKPSQFRMPDQGKPNLLISGGSLGVGGLKRLIGDMKDHSCTCFVLCGKNQKLYTSLHNEHSALIRPLRYIESREQMNEIYDLVDAVISKPGGVTISECIRKQKPVFIYHALPGQEEINLKLIKQLGIAKDSIGRGNLEQQIIRFFDDDMEATRLEANLAAYHRDLSLDASTLLYKKLISR
ncbi:MGDG synthase family glycosyltransferase [Sediminibacillus halophilus]|uniref:UDP-N-acetylglucosamine:LPS N-acetylglucosamine transferase n=1 Tax=Sediminibacillus halophilus TaxID=482461 RepID=A0A1G9NYU8_9BACI|nr:glycosyltransferase [Sediminibacillus halophilus]SDL91524.1 UDP-N-acetylglucosamine:LPS N-acetylglucosamine transferase [Sediminibacillus halophilus]